MESGATLSDAVKKVGAKGIETAPVSAQSLDHDASLSEVKAAAKRIEAKQNQQTKHLRAGASCSVNRPSTTRRNSSGQQFDDAKADRKPGWMRIWMRCARVARTRRSPLRRRPRSQRRCVMRTRTTSSP